MSTTTSPANGSPSVTELVSGIVGDVQDLGMQHLALFRHEVKEDVRKASDAAASLAIGLAVAQVGGLLICLMAVHLLSTLAPNLSMWSCYGIVGALVVAVGALAVANGLMKLKSVESLSKQTAEIIKDDAQWLTQPK
jgi:hypothetical protein